MHTYVPTATPEAESASHRVTVPRLTVDTQYPYWTLKLPVYARELQPLRQKRKKGSIMVKTSRKLSERLDFNWTCVCLGLRLLSPRLLPVQVIFEPQM